MLGWFPENAVAAQYGGNDRAQRYGNRKVPRGDESDHSLGIEPYLSTLPWIVDRVEVDGGGHQ